MPELPEVETTRRGIEPALLGARIMDVSVRRARMSRRQPNPADIPGRLIGRKVREVGRVGKFLIVDIEDDFSLVMHLGMSGRLCVADRGDPEDAHTNIVITTETSREIRMVDPRTFGFIVVYTPEELAGSSIATLGPDALDALPRSPRFMRRMAGRSVAIKTLLLDQRFLAGLGNIYADEVLHRARVDPLRQAGSLVAQEVSAIRKHIRPVLADGLAYGGTSLGDLAYLLPDGRAGEYFVRLRVYGREGESCRRCRSTIIKRVVGGRSPFSCPSCQR